MSIQNSSNRPRAREAGIIVGSLPPGANNAITDVAGVRVGHTTVVEGHRVHTGVTAILPHPGNLFQERVPAAIHVANGFGKLTGVTQVRELGELETPILLTSTLSVWRVADAVVTWMLAKEGMQDVQSINPVVGENNDGFLSDTRSRPISPEHVTSALENSKAGPVEEGAVGAGAGTVAFGWKGGIGTSSRKLPSAQGGYTIGVLIQSNFGGDLTINGTRIRPEALRSASTAKSANESLAAAQTESPNSGDGSIMIIVATDAPLGPRKLERLASRAILGLARTGASMSNGSGDYVIAFSTAAECRIHRGKSVHNFVEVPNESMTPLFQAVAEATEEAILNSLFKAETVKGFKGTIQALPVEKVLQLLKTSGLLQKQDNP